MFVGGDVLWSTDVIGEAALFARFLCERRAKVAGNFVNLIKFRQNDERKGRKVFDEEMSGQADISRSRENVQTMPLSNETSEQRDECHAAQRKRAAVKPCNESSKGKERLRDERERAAAKRAHETSQEKELRSRARALSVSNDMHESLSTRAYH